MTENVAVLEKAGEPFGWIDRGIVLRALRTVTAIQGLGTKCRVFEREPQWGWVGRFPPKNGDRCGVFSPDITHTLHICALLSKAASCRALMLSVP